MLQGAETSHNNLPFPYKFYSRIRKHTVESQLIFIRDSLELIEDLYHHNNRSSVAWDTKKTDEFLMTVYRQRDEISHCILTRRRTGQWLKNYYKTLKSTLDDMGGSSASWEMIRNVTDDHLYRLNLLVHFMLKKQKN
ncbi:interferon a3-like [Etheostoma cragini]|uniref:interferon a3-like n=1 Tax=Etheostoma cragini TaxID=417921 RepID=UPI00155EDAF3|nr:interferon a3-like [Etheostoma cragini]